MSKIDVAWILFDVASTKKQKLLTGLLEFATYQWLRNPKNNYRLMLVNTKSTQNIRDSPNIYVFEESSRYDPKFIKNCVEESEPTDSPTAKFEALTVAMHYLKQCQDDKRIVTRQVIYFTCLEHENPGENEELLVDKIISRVNKYDVYLYFIGPEVDLPYPITFSEMVYECMGDLKIDESNENLKIAHKIVKGTNNSIMCRVEIGAPHLLLSFKLSPGTQPWVEPLSFGENFRVPVKTCKIIRKDLNLKLERDSSQTTTKQKVLADNVDVVVDEADIIKGRVVAGQLLQFDLAQFRPDTKKCLDVLGFVDKKSIPPTMLLGEDVFKVLPHDDKEEWFQFFTYLVKELDECGKYGLVKRVYAATNKPRYFALIPDVVSSPKCFIMTALPYRHEYVPIKCEIPTAPVKAPENTDEVTAYLNSLTIEKEKPNSRIPLGPAMMLAEEQRKIVQQIINNCLGEGEEELKFSNFFEEDHLTNIELN